MESNDGVKLCSGTGTNLQLSKKMEITSENNTHNGHGSQLSTDRMPTKLEATFTKSTKKLDGSVTYWLTLSTLAVSIGCGSQMGYNGGGSSVPAPFIKEFLNQTNYSKWNGFASEFILTWIYSVTVTMFAFGAALGSMLSRFFSDEKGRKTSILYANVLSLIGALCMGLCQIADIYGLLVLGRFIIGIYGGFTFTIMPFYLAEISPINLRGSVGVVSSLCRASGTLLAHICGFALFYSQEKWPIQLALTGLMAIFNIIVFPFCPESPRWLFITKNRREEAIQALRKLRGPDVDLTPEIEEMEAERRKNMKATQNKKIDTFEILKFKRPEWKMALLLGARIQLGIGLSGFSTVMMYTTDVYASAGMDRKEVAFATIGLSSLNTVMTGISVLVVDRVGRRPLLLIPFALGVVSLLGITVFINQQENYDFMKWLTVAIIYLYISTFSLGPVSIKNLIAAEMWLQDARPAAMSIIMQVNWWTTVFMNLTFPVLESAIGSYIYLFYTVCLLAATVLLFFNLPETKQKTFDEIVTGLLRKKNASDRDLAEVYEMDIKVDDFESTTETRTPTDLRTNFEVLTSLPNII